MRNVCTIAASVFFSAVLQFPLYTPEVWEFVLTICVCFGVYTALVAIHNFGKKD